MSEENSAPNQSDAHVDKKRHHTRLNLPAQIKTNGQIFDIRDISAGGLGIYNAKDYFAIGKTYSVSLHFPFEAFTLTLSLESQIVHIDHDTQITGCRFVNLNENQIEILTYIINSFMTGDLIDGKSILEKQGAQNFVHIQKISEEKEDVNSSSKIKNIMGSFFKRK